MSASSARTDRIRSPVVAGLFYPERREALAELIDRLAREVGVPGKREEARAVIVPHGPYHSSGPMAAAVYAGIRLPETAVVLGPNHSGVEQGVAVEGVWETPLGKLPVDRDLARAVLKHARDLKKNQKVHEEEHSIEVQLPFLQRMGRVRGLVPVLVAPADLETLRRTGQGIARAIQAARGKVLLICSTQLTRYEARQEAQRKDAWAIESMLELDEERLLQGVTEKGLSMCGAAPAAVVLSAAKMLGASRGVLARHEVSGAALESDSVVGYAGVILV